MARVAIPDFQLANPLYAGAAVTYYTVDGDGESTGVAATLYAAPTGSQTVNNPQRLDSDGKFESPVYIAAPVIGEVTGANVESHTLGVHGMILADAAGLTASTLAAGIFGAAVLLAALPTTDVGAADRAQVLITGASSTITSLGSGANQFRILATENPQTFQTSADLVAPDGEYISKPGAPFVAISDDDGVWTICTGDGAYKQRGSNTKSRHISDRLRNHNDFIDWLPAIINLDTIADYSITTDLSTYFNNMVADVDAAGGGVIDLPKGLIPVASAICQSGMHNIIFRGQGGQDLLYAGNSGTVIKFTGTGSGRAVDMRDHRGVWWLDLQMVYSSNLFTGTVFDCSSSFSTGNASGFERVQVYQSGGSLHTAAEGWYLKNNVDATFRNCYASHVNYGWVGVRAGDVGSETNCIRLDKCTAIGVVTSAIHNPVIGWTADTCNWELTDSGTPGAVTTSGSFDIKDACFINCKSADATANGIHYNFTNNTFNLKIIGGAILQLSGTATGVNLGGTFHGGTTIRDVEFDGLSVGINYAAADCDQAEAIGNLFLSTVTPISNMANCDVSSLFLRNNPDTANRALKEGYGGTGQSSYTAGDLLYASGTTTLSKRAIGASRTFLKSLSGVPNYEALLPADCPSLNPIYIGAKGTAVNFNSVADTALTINLPTGVTNYRIQSIMIGNASGDISSAQVALYSAAGAGGTAILTPSAVSVTTASLNTANSLQSIGPSIAAVLNLAQVFFRVTTGHGAARTADVWLQIQPLP